MTALKERSVPINLRQSGKGNARILISTRIRKSPYWHLSARAGCWAYTTYNHMYHPRAYVALEDGGLLKEYEYLTQHVSMWDVAVERQIQIKGPDAANFVNLLITRDVHKKIPVNQARYVILCNQKGGIINDPILLRISENEFWFSISDSDVLLWAQGVLSFANYDVSINEIDVCPVQIQGPKSAALLVKLFGQEILNIPYYGLTKTKLNGLDLTISRTGFSAELGFEIYLHNATANADEMWTTIEKAGEEFNLKVIAPSHIRRLEAGILSYGQDMDIETNPFEVGLGWQVDFSKPNFIGKEALWGIKQRGVEQRLMGLKLGGTAITWYTEDFYPVQDASSGESVGYISSAFFSPTLSTNIGLAMLPTRYTTPGTRVKALLPNDGLVDAEVTATPFVDPKKQTPSQQLKQHQP